jgi:hypothetical protein
MGLLAVTGNTCVAPSSSPLIVACVTCVDGPLLRASGGQRVDDVAGNQAAAVGRRLPMHGRLLDPTGASDRWLPAQAVLRLAGTDRKLSS